MIDIFSKVGYTNLPVVFICCILILYNNTVCIFNICITGVSNRFCIRVILSVVLTDTLEGAKANAYN